MKYVVLSDMCVCLKMCSCLRNAIRNGINGRTGADDNREEIVCYEGVYYIPRGEIQGFDYEL